MALTSEQDLKYAAEFREGVHREALERVRRAYPGATEVIDRYPVEEYYEDVWDYPGKWYSVIAVPKAAGSRASLIETIVRDTLEHYRTGKAPDENRQRASAAAQTRQGEEATVSASLQDPFYDLIARYPDCVIDYCIVANGPVYQGYESHRQALDTACETLFAPGGDSETWHYNVKTAMGKRIDAGELFVSNYREGKLNYRKAFLYPPHENGYTGADFVKVNAALFPNGTDQLEVYEWTTDWSDYFDDGHEWWGTLCLTVYNRSMNRFVVILASATD